MRDDAERDQGNGEHPAGGVEDAPGPVALAFGQQLKQVRLARPRGEETYRGFAKFLGEVQPGRRVSPGHLCEVEKGGQKPSRAVVERIDQQCGTKLIESFPALEAEHEAKLAAKQQRRQQLAEFEGRSSGGRRRRGSSTTREDATDTSKQTSEGYADGTPAREASPDGAAAIEEAETKRREAIKAGGAAGLLLLSSSRARRFLQWAEKSNVGPLTIDGYRQRLAALTENAFALPSITLFDRADAEFASIAARLEWEDQVSKQRRELEMLAAQFSYCQARFAFKLGDNQVTHDCLAIAQHFGEQHDHHELLAAVKILDSSIAFYGGRYEEAVWFARDGRRFVTPHSAARLAGNEARALGASGPSRLKEMREALDVAEGAVLDRPLFVAGADSPFGPETLALYGSMACRGAGDARAEIFARETVRQYDALRQLGDERAHYEDLTLGKLEISSSLVASRPPEPTEAARVAIAALAMPRSMQTDQIKRRAKQLLAVLLANWPNLPLVKEFAEVVRAYRPPLAALPARPSRPGLGPPDRR